MHRAWSTYLEASSNSSHGHGHGQESMHSQDAGSATRRPLNGRLHRREPSAMSHTNSMASSQRHILADHQNMTLEPPVAPFAGQAAPGSPTGSQRSSNIPLEGSATNSLSINFVPSKFSRPISPGGLYKRKVKGGKGSSRLALPKLGGGREAFKRGEARMPGEKDEDYDGVDVSRSTWKSKLRWNRFKWILFCTNLVFSVYSLVAFIFCLLTWFNVWTHADVVRVGNRTELILSTIAASTGVLTSLLGWSGILLNNRSFLATYTLLLWVTFGLIIAPGYVTYKTRTFNLEGKVNAQWSRALGIDGRLRIQNELTCCGYYSPFVEATASQLCYARSVLPGCKNAYLKFERMVLERWYAVAFGLVPLQLIAILSALLCSNHVTFRFGKGMMPKAYRLDTNTMALIMDNYATQLAEQYGADFASELLARSRSNLQLDSMPSLHYGSSGTNTPPIPGYQGTGSASHAHYASLGGASSDYDAKKM